MPNRIIKESICTSETAASLTDFEFRLWIGLILVADDAGRGDARAAVLRGRVFPLRERVTVRDVESALHGLAAKGCVSLYTVGGKPYFWFPTWTKHQRIRDCKPKYPGPEESDAASAADCGELRQLAAVCGGLRPESESESESESEVYTHPTLPREGAPGPKTPDLNPDGETGGRSHAPAQPKKPNPPDPFTAYAGEDAELLKALQAFGEMRLKIKKPMTDRAKQQLCARLDALAGDSAGKIRLLDEAVLHCWQSVYVHEGGGKSRGTASPVSSAPGEDSIRREELRQWEELLTYGAIQEGGGGV